VSSKSAESGTGIPRLAGGENIALDAARTLQAAKNGGGRLMDGNEPGYRPAPLGDRDFLAFALYFIEQAETLRFEEAGANFLLHDYVHITIVRYGKHKPSQP
jgi:hypothetical protein